MALDYEALDRRVTDLERLAGEIRAQADRGLPLDGYLPRLEQLVADLRTELGPPPPPWWARLGPVTDPEAFEEAMRLGREYRRTGRLPDDADPQP